MSELVIKQKQRTIATAKSCVKTWIPALEGWDAANHIKCFFFYRVNMSPPILFEHLAGTGLVRFLDNTELYQDDVLVCGSLRYVHGRSEVMRGTSTINSVLLARPEPEDAIDQASWLVRLPEIYKAFLANQEVDSEKP